jgi:hypothetical protein
MTKYDTSLALYDQSIGIGNAPEEHVRYILENTGGNAEVTCLFRDNKLALCMVDAPPNASLIYTQNSHDILTSARGIMERYQTFTGDSSITEMLTALDAVDAVGNLTKTVGNVKLEITSTSNTHMIMFDFKHTYNDVYYNEIQFSYDDLGFTFADYFSRYKMGSTDVKILEQQAIDSAIKCVKAYSYEAVGGSEGNETKVMISDFKVNKERTTAELLPGERGSLLYPCWKVEVALDDLYPGNVYAFSVQIWADNGEVLNCIPLAVGYTPPEDTQNNGLNALSTDNPTPPVSNDQKADTGIDLITVSIATALLVLILTVAAMIVYRKKKAN